MGNIISYEETSGSIVSFETDVAKGIKSLKVNISPIQEGSDDPSPDNVRPISGWTGTNITVNGSTVSITFPLEAGTMYGGTLDVVKGTLTLTHKGGFFNDLYSSGLTAMTTNASDVRRWGLPKSMFDGMANAVSNNRPEDFLCSAYKTISAANTMARMKGISVTQSGLVVIFDENYSDKATTSNSGAVTYFSNINPFFVWRLETPITYQLTPQEINTIIGINTIYANTGNVSVYYPKTFTPVETLSDVNLLDLRRSIIAFSQMKSKPVITTYGVEWNYADSSTVLTRTGAASSFANPIPAESLNEVGWSPFDNVYPWSEMKRYNIINGEVAYSEDDAGYSETDYDTVVYIPEFYYKAEKNTTNQKWNWNISGIPIEGYKKHPGSGRYVGRFHTSGNSSDVFSKGDVTPLANITRANFRIYSHNKGSNWWQIDLATWSAIQMLYLVEFANWNSQSVLGGGQNSDSIGVNGATTGAIYHTLKRSKASNTYRWIENPFSNLLTWVDGYVASSRASYISIDPASYGDTVSGMETAGITLPSSNYITGIGYSEKCTWAFIPDAASGGSENMKVSDYMSSNSSGIRMLCCGGYFRAGGYYGIFFFHASNSATYAYADIGSRLIYIPTT